MDGTTTWGSRLPSCPTHIATITDRPSREIPLTLRVDHSVLTKIRPEYSKFLFDAFSSREPVSTPHQVRGRLSLENALRTRTRTPSCPLVWHLHPRRNRRQQPIMPVHRSSYSRQARLIDCRRRSRAAPVRRARRPRGRRRVRPRSSAPARILSASGRSARGRRISCRRNRSPARPAPVRARHAAERCRSCVRSDRSAAPAPPGIRLRDRAGCEARARNRDRDGNPSPR